MSEREFQHNLDDELLSAYIDDQLSPGERASVEARLASDPDAQRLLHQLRSVSQSVQALPQAPARFDFRDEILRRVKDHKSTPADAREDAVKNLTTKTSNDTIFQSRRPWIWATLTLAAGLLIMVVQWDNQSADKLRDVAQNAGPADADREAVDRKLGESRPTADFAAPESSSLARTAELEESRAQPMAGGAPPIAPEVALSGKSSTDKLSFALPDFPAAAPPVPESKPADATAVALDELNRTDRFAAAGAPAAATAPQDGLATTAAEGPGAFGGANFKGGSGTRSPSFSGATSPPTSLPGAASAPAPPMNEQLAGSDIATDSLVVVHVVAKQSAIESKSFETLLKTRGISIESEHALDANGRAGGIGGRAENRPAEESKSLRVRAEPAADTADVVLVEAPESTIVEFLSELNNDETNYSSIAVDEPASTQAALSVNGNLKKEHAADLGTFSRGVELQKRKDDNTTRYFHDPGRREAKEAAPQGSVASGKESSLEETKQLRRDSIEAATAGRARRLSLVESDRPRVVQSVDQARAAVAAQVEKSVKRRSASNAKAPTSGQTDQLQVLFVLSPETAAVPSTPAAKSAE